MKGLIVLIWELLNWYWVRENDNETCMQRRKTTRASFKARQPNTHVFTTEQPNTETALSNPLKASLCEPKGLEVTRTHYGSFAA